jgi:uncharacterized membrane protein
MTALYAAGGLLVLAQLVGLYGLKTRKADFVFALLMGVLVLVAIAIGIDAVIGHLHR